MTEKARGAEVAKMKFVDREGSCCACELFILSYYLLLTIIFTHLLHF